ncbi:MAG: PIG-L deacetylase family protein [Chloroflexia bacterium]
MQNNSIVPRTVLVVVAHPDDMEFTCGGAIAKWADAGSSVHLVVATSGDKGTKDRETSPHTMADIREREQAEAAKVLGIQKLTFLRHRDGELEVSMAFRNQLSSVIRTTSPEALVTHDPWRAYQIHPDHRAIGTVSIDAIVAARDHLYVPEQLLAGLEPHHTSHIFLFSTDSPDHLEDVSDFMDRKMDALGCHHSQLDHLPNWRDRVIEWCRLTGERIGVSYAEAFKHIELL